MANISVFVLPEPGHLMPTLRIASALKAKGHRICYLTTNQYGRMLADLGFDCRYVFSDIVEPEDPHRSVFDVALTKSELWLRVSAREGNRLIGLHDVLSQCMRTTLLEAMAETQPDMVLCDAIVPLLCGDLLEQRFSVPVVSLNTQLPDGDLHAGGLEYVLCPRELEIDSDSPCPPWRRYCEPSIYRRRPAEPFGWGGFASDRRLAYCALGTQCAMYPEAARVLRAVAEGVAALGTHDIVIAAGRLADVPELKELPPCVRIVRTAPQLMLLERADFTIVHGGLGSVKEAIVACVPMLVVPFYFDQPANARRVATHGLGRTCAPAACTPETIRDLCAELASDRAVRVNLDRMARIFRAREAEAPAIAGLESILHAHAG